jgi:hypothetical protein
VKVDRWRGEIERVGLPVALLGDANALAVGHAEAFGATQGLQTLQA